MPLRPTGQPTTWAVHAHRYRSPSRLLTAADRRDASQRAAERRQHWAISWRPRAAVGAFIRSACPEAALAAASDNNEGWAMYRSAVAIEPPLFRPIHNVIARRLPAARVEAA